MTTHVDLKLKSKLYYYAATVTDVYDGDTLTVNIDLGLGIWRHGQTIRLWKVNTPELKGPERERGLQVRNFVQELLLGKTVLVRTILDKRGQDNTEKFGRLLGEILVEAAHHETINVNDLLLEKGMARKMSAEGSLMPEGVLAAPWPLPIIPDIIVCPYCGEARNVSIATHVVEQCTNCLDLPFQL